MIKIGCNETPKEYEFYVEDNGIGIDPRHHQEIFDTFKGLALVKAALEDQGGRVRVESSLGQGAKFIFTIPN